MSYVHKKFPGSPEQVVCTTYDLLGISAVIPCAVLGEIQFLANLQLQNFLHSYIENLY